jgi:hypothetical protein
MHDFRARAAVAVAAKQLHITTAVRFTDSKVLPRLSTRGSTLSAWAKVQDEDVVVMSVDHLFKADARRKRQPT